ncbi:biphenyl 2,3-dioxygenase [Rhodobacteraceae bacterium RKSG542]|uniref:multicopper oxidase domain-containing protein n=1 Tax=Pseudovibrio flavus TaxID=2529854 RepID=UPI0012BC7855|nr:multicopper oxidase domain-containing protein [Pseudovibrio flavus]MTI15966.1 biphenyl 2,3-dioxygenase [Pseudovibrio flavus]
MMKRRDFLFGSAALATGAVLAGKVPLVGMARAAAPDLDGRARLQMPPLLDATQSGEFTLNLQEGTQRFVMNNPSPTFGINQGYLGPTVRMAPGSSRADVKNTLDEGVAMHWHGLLVPGEQDGGPHQPIAAGGRWNTDLDINQLPATAWYHAHTHGRTAQQVYNGLAGFIQIDDGRDHDRGLPSNYGVDDLFLVIQDKRFDENGLLVFDSSMMTAMHGFFGNTIVVNGQVGAVCTPPKGLTRLRLLNGSNARSYGLFFDDLREMHLIATDSGYLQKPTALTQLRLAPGERVEVLVDFSKGGPARLLSWGDMNQSLKGYQGPIPTNIQEWSALGAYSILPFQPDERLKSGVDRLPDELDGEPAEMAQKPVRTREFTLDMGMGMMMARAMGGSMMGINGKGFDMERIDVEAKVGTVERWIISAHMQVHPFHIHGVKFLVENQVGQPPRPEERGWKDTVIVEEESQVLVRFDHAAPKERPYMYHCHILEHEDAGMMGQMSVT